MDSVLSDNEAHSISVLFWDEYAIRARRMGLAPGETASLTSLAERDIKAVQAVVSSPGIICRPTYLSTEAESEANLKARQDRVLVEHGYMPPNQASWISLSLEPFTKERAKEIVHRLQGLPQVRTVSIPPSLRPAAPVYAAPPATEPKFPSNWQANDLENTQTFMDNYASGIGVRWWWWNRHSIGAAWQYGKGNGIRVAVLDNCFQTDFHDGVQYDNSLKRRFYSDGTWSVDVRPDAGTSPLLPYGGESNGALFHHGSAVASLIGASDTNGIGICGVAPNASIVPIRTTSGYISIVAGINYAVQIGAKVINISRELADASLGSNPENQADYRYALRNAYDQGVTVVISSGNSNQQVALPTNPNNFTYAIFVGGIDRENNYYYANTNQATNHGPRVDIAAAGQNMAVPANWILQSGGTTFAFGNSVISEAGTSFAAPLVAGAATIVRQYTQNPNIVRDILIGTADIKPSVYGNTVNYSNMTVTYGGAYDAIHKMSSNRDGTQTHMNGTEGWSKIRVLNAYSAAKVAVNYASGNTYIVYRAASDDYTQNKRVSPTPVTTEDGWNPLNFFTTYSPTATVEAWSWQTPGNLWASASTVFKHGRIQSYEVMGSGTTRSYYGQIIQNIWSSRGGAPSNTNGWVDGTSYVLN